MCPWKEPSCRVSAAGSPPRRSFAPTATCPAGSTTRSRPGSRPNPAIERAELVKHHLDVLWHDYFKPEHLEKVPNLHELFWNANKQVSKVKASTDLADAKKLLDQIDEIDAAWKATGGEEKTRVAGRPS